MLIGNSIPIGAARVKHAGPQPVPSAKLVGPRPLKIPRHPFRNHGQLAHPDGMALHIDDGRPQHIPQHIRPPRPGHGRTIVFLQPADRPLRETLHTGRRVVAQVAKEHRSASGQNHIPRLRHAEHALRLADVVVALWMAQKHHPAQPVRGNKHGQARREETSSSPGGHRRQQPARHDQPKRRQGHDPQFRVPGLKAEQDNRVTQPPGAGRGDHARIDGRGKAGRGTAHPTANAKEDHKHKGRERNRCQQARHRRSVTAHEEFFFQHPSPICSSHPFAKTLISEQKVPRDKVVTKRERPLNRRQQG